MKKNQALVFMGLLIALEIVLTRFFAIQTPIIRISFGFIPLALSSIMFGPVLGGITAALCDILGMMLFPQGAYFPGFTFSALLSGAVYGLLLYKKPNNIWRLIIAVLVVSLVVDIGLNTLWLSMLMNKAAMAILIPRLIKTAIMVPVQVFLIGVVWRYTSKLIKF